MITDVADLRSIIYHPPDEEYLPFQLASIMEMTLRKNVLLGDEMGLGKTIQVCGYINLVKPPKVLVICPNNLRINWIEECEKWIEPSLLESYEMDQCTSSGYFGGNLVIASYEGLLRYANTLRKEHWDLIVVDEAHYVKSRSAKRSQALFSLGTPNGDLEEILGESNGPKKIMLTGTPICNYPYEIFPLIHWLDPDTWPSAAAFEGRYMPYGNKYGYHLSELQEFLRRGKPIGQGEFEERVVVHERGPKQYECWGPGMISDHPQGCGFITTDPVKAMDHCIGNRHRVVFNHAFTPEVQKIEKKSLSTGVMIRRLKKEVLPELPKKRRQIIAFPAEDELLALVEEENALWQKHSEVGKALDELFDLSDVVESDEGFESKIDNLRQTRRYFFDEIALIRHKIGRAKVPYVCEHLENLLENKDKIVLFGHHRDVLQAIHERFHDVSVPIQGGMDSTEVYTKKDKFWKDPKIQLFIGSIKMAGVGLNLQVSSTVIFAELDWVPGVITQAEDRCHRIGQDSSVLIQHLVAQDSMDSVMAKRIVAKQKSINKALNRE